MTMFEPVFGGNMTEETEIKVAYDENFIYVAGRLFTKNTGDIRANSLYRDRYSEGDVFAIIIDPFNDDQNGLWFFVNPAGVRVDIALSNDADFSTGNVFNSSWNTFWTAETSQTPEGWTAEMRIPFSSIGLQVDNGDAEIGFITYRFLANTNERHIYPAIEPNWPLANAKPSKAQDVVLKDVKGQNPVYFTPYVLGGLQQINQLNAAQTEYAFDNDVTREIGFDLRYNVTSNLTLDVTANTDFAQVEADDQQVNLSRFPLFFPERRQFFQERAGIFDFRLRGQDQVFFSRRIGLGNNGQPTRIFGGTRLTGRVGNWDIGFINMQTEENANLPSENFGILRLRKRVLNTNSFVGGITTTRFSPQGQDVSYGLDALLNVAGDEYINAKVSQTFNDGFNGNTNSSFINSSVFSLNWTRRTNQGLYYSSSFFRYGEDYNPAVGFITRRNFTSSNTRISYADLIEGDSPIRRWDVNIANNAFFRNTDGTVQTWRVSSFNAIQFKSGARIAGGGNFNYEDLRNSISFLPNTNVAEGSYRFFNGFLNYNTTNANLFRIGFGVDGGQFYDGYSFSASVDPTWNVSRHLELGGTYQINGLRFPDRDEAFDAHIIRFRAQGALNREISGSTFVQYSNVADLVGINFRFRYNFREGNDLWLVWNETLNTERNPFDRTLPQLPLTDNRVILIKYTFTFIK